MKRKGHPNIPDFSTKRVVAPAPGGPVAKPKPPALPASSRRQAALDIEEVRQTRRLPPKGAGSHSLRGARTSSMQLRTNAEKALAITADVTIVQR